MRFDVISPHSQSQSNLLQSAARGVSGHGSNSYWRANDESQRGLSQGSPSGSLGVICFGEFGENDETKRDVENFYLKIYTTSMTKLIIGLGNPDEEYQNTRHNVGFMMVDYIAKKNDCGDFEFNKKLNSLVAKYKVGKNQVFLAKPQTYVNKTGEAASKLKSFYKIKSEDIVLVHDDLDIEFGNFKLSFGKNSGGHKGVESVMKSLKTKNFWRLRIGTAVRALAKAREQSDKKRDAFVMGFVLSKFSKKEDEELKKLLKESYERLTENIK